MMPDSLSRLIRGLIDYAGLYPPAQLEMAGAVREFSEIRQGPHSWMVSRFVVPVARLEEFAAQAAQHGQDVQWRLALVGTAADAPSTALQTVEADLTAVDEFHHKYQSLATPECYEVRLPEPCFGTEWAKVADALSCSVAKMDLFVEAPFGDLSAGAVEAIVSTAASAGIACKIRTGGLNAAAFPSVESVATFVGACAKARCRFKATAGLHHPVRSYHESVRTHMHGFFNLFVAAVLAFSNRIENERLKEVIAEGDPSAFQFDGIRLAWRGIDATADEISTAREFALGFGSCSIAEPIEDLTALGYLPMSIV